jgi:superfamily I DNA/RNA helicase
MTYILYTKLKGQNHDKTVNAKIMTFMSKLSENDESPGLHIEKMNNPADQRARTGRVDGGLRAVLFRLDIPGADRTYVYAGTWKHDEAIRRARTQILRRNPINGVTEFIDSSTLENPKNIVPLPTKPPTAKLSYLAERAYLLTDLTQELGFDKAIAERIFAATSDDELLTIAESFENQWQINAVIALAMGDALTKICADLGFVEAQDVVDVSTQEERLAKSLLHPASRMQFVFVDNDQELRQVIEGGDFGAWRVFLHPEQRSSANKDFNGPFRLTGGAGTGKTVVLLHRTAQLAAADPSSRVVLTTFTKALSSALQRDLERLDSTVPRASELGDSGVLVRGVDQLAVAVRDKAGEGFWAAARHVFGEKIEPCHTLDSSEKHWQDAINEVQHELPESLRNPSFFEGEYLQVVLPHRIFSQVDYFRVRRPGRGIALDRRKRAAVWKVIEQYRQTARLVGRLSFAEVSAIAAAYLDENPTKRVADHVLIDEAQDLSPLHWQLLRALVAAGKNDLFIAEDSHQRIYGRHIVLSRFGVRIVGRSRRLTLNYRTTQENLNYALGLLEGGRYFDSEDVQETKQGYRSSRTGPRPRALAASNETEQYANLAELVREWVDDQNSRPETFAILTRSNAQATNVKNQLAERGVSVTESHTGETVGNNPLVLTMHKSKGLEFARVVLFDVSKGAIPPTWVLEGVAAEELEEVWLRERSLLYVAASRARDELVVSWSGEPSELLQAMKTGAEKRR